MILKFDEYFEINEEKNVKSFDEIEINSHWPTYGMMKKNFMSVKYRFLGTIYCDWKDINRYYNDGFEKVFTERIKEVCDKFTSDGLSVTIEENDAGSVTYDEFSEIISKNVDEVTSCKTNSGKIYYAFFNRDEKYFYFMYVHPRVMALSAKLKLWLRLKTTGEDIVYKELLAEKERREEEKRRAEKRRMEKDIEDKRQKENLKEYEKYVEILKADVEKNPENYKRVDDYVDLPRIVKDSLSHIIESDYVEYKKSLIKNNPYEYHYDVYINKRDLSDGYVYETYESLVKNGYRGD